MLRVAPLLLIVLAGCAGLVPADAGDAGSGGTGRNAATAYFPNVFISESASDEGVVDMEHVGGDCITLTELTFRVEGSTVTPRTSVLGGTSAQEFCVGDHVYLDGYDGQANEIVVIDDARQAQVYKRTIQL